MGTEKKVTISDAVTNNWLTKKEFADQLDVTVNNLNQLLANGVKAKKFPKPSGMYSQKRGKVRVYSPEYVELVSATRSPSSRKPKSALGRAFLKVTVPIFDEHAAKFLLKKFGSEEAIDSFLRDKLMEVYKPVMSKLAEIEERYAKEKAAALSGN